MAKLPTKEFTLAHDALWGGESGLHAVPCRDFAGNPVVLGSAFGGLGLHVGIDGFTGKPSSAQVG